MKKFNGFSKTEQHLILQTSLCNGLMKDFLLWGFLKDTVYENHPASIAELKQAINSKIRKIKKAGHVKVINNLARRINECLKQNSGHLEHVLK